MSKKTYFNSQWLEFDKFPLFKGWLSSSNIDTAAYCTVCKRKIDLSNMGKQALTSHANGKVHKNNFDIAKNITSSVPPIQSFFHSNKNSSQDISNALPPLLEESTSRTVSTEHSGQITQWVTKDETTRAEIIWMLHMTKQHFSFNSSSNTSSIFSAMFPDSAIAAQIKLSPTKVAYSITFGVAPYFQSLLYQKIKLSSFFSICFDEALNSVIQKIQMDIWVRFWNFETSQVNILSLLLSVIF